MRAPYDFRDKAPSFTTISMTVPSNCPAPTKNTSTVVETSCSYVVFECEARECQSYHLFFFNHHFTVSIIPLKLQEHHLKINARTHRYEFPNSKCPSDFPVLQCKETSDCVTDDGQSFTCGGEIVACDSSSHVCKSSKGSVCERTKTITHIKGGVELVVNTETSVVGSVSVGILDENGDSISGFSVEDADPIQGNTVNAVASWGGGVTASLSDLAGKTIQIQVAMRDAKLYSLELHCDNN